jgi:hypothetical protein
MAENFLGKESDNRQQGAVSEAMRREDSLSQWLIYEGLMGAPDKSTLRHVTHALDQLQALIRPSRTEKKRDFGSIRGLLGSGGPVRLPSMLRARVETLYPEVWGSHGVRKHTAEDALLQLIGFTADPASVPFLREVLALGRVGDTFTARRRQLVLSSLAHIVIRHRDPAAYEALCAAARHEKVEQRTDAVSLLGRGELYLDGSLDARTQDLLAKVAAEDTAFGPRFLARLTLLDANPELPALDPDQILAVQARYERASRTIELRATATLAALAGTILTAFGWDHDHLYEFHMTGDRRDGRFTLPPADDSSAFERAILPPMFFGMDLVGEDDDRPPASSQKKGRGRSRNDKRPSPRAKERLREVCLGHLELPAGHKFLFHYDFGDDHWFELTVVETDRKANRRARYPRVADQSGRAPEQYKYW